MSNPKVSVIISYFNAEKYIAESVSSVLASTYRNFELILVNDASTDNSERIARRFEDRRIVHISLKENRGPAYGRNRGLEAASGEYIGFLDADDKFTEQKLEIQTAYLEQHPDIALTAGSYYYIDAEGKIIEELGNYGAVKQRYVTDEEIRAYMLFGNCIANGGTLFRRSLICDNFIRQDESLRRSQDYKFWLDCLPYGKIEGLDRPLYYYRYNHKTTKEDQTREYFDMMLELVSYGWKTRGFRLDREEMAFIYYHIWKGKRLRGLKDYRKQKQIRKKIAFQLKELSLPEGALILKYYKRYMRQRWKI